MESSILYISTFLARDTTEWRESFFIVHELVLLFFLLRDSEFFSLSTTEVPLVQGSDVRGGFSASWRSALWFSAARNMTTVNVFKLGSFDNARCLSIASSAIHEWILYTATVHRHYYSPVERLLGLHFLVSPSFPELSIVARNESKRSEGRHTVLFISLSLHSCFMC